MGPIACNEGKNTTKHFCLDDYDCLAFDMDHTMVNYHLPEVFKLIYRSIVDHLVKEKGYSEDLIHVDNFAKYEDFALRGIIFEHGTGNFVKLDKNGYVLRRSDTPLNEKIDMHFHRNFVDDLLYCNLSCSHGMVNLTEDEIIKEYGKERLWPFFDVLKKKVYHADGYTMMENFFLMPAASIIGQIVEDCDKKHDGTRLKDYGFIWKDIAEGLNLNFTPASFKEDSSFFFPSIRNNTAQFVKKCSPEVINWLKKIRSSGKILCLITDSYADFAELLMTYAIGPSWKELFDYVVVYANKPNFFYKEFEERKFLAVNPDTIFEDAKPVDSVKKHTMYARGHSKKVVKLIKEETGKKNPKIVYFGDSIKSDVFPPKVYAQWDTVAVLEELEAEEVHYHRNKQISPSPKRPKLSPLLKEEKLIIASNQWGSFFTHPTNEKERKEKEHQLNTFWGDLVKTYSKLAIPVLDYIADLPLQHEFEPFSTDITGFYPSPPRSVLVDDCENESL